MTKKHIPGRLQISTDCNHECIFCSVPEMPVQQLTLDEIKEKITHLKSLGTNDLFITGGEPTIYPHLFEILDFAKKQDFNEITLQSNCSNLSTSLLNKIKSYGNVKFNISFHSHEKELSNHLSNTNNYDNIISGLKRVIDIGIPTFLTIVINKLNYKDLRQQIIFIKEKFPEITHFSFNFIDPTGRAKQNSWIVPTLTETEGYIHKTVEYILKNKMTFRLERVPLCYMGGFEEFSTEVRMPALGEKRLTYFAEAKKEANIEDQKEYTKTGACNCCYLNRLCSGLNPNYVSIHGVGELYPVFTKPQQVISKISGSKSYFPHNSIEKKVSDDLKLFKKAIELKPNKNNIYDTYAYYLMQGTGLKNRQYIYDAWKTLINKINTGEEQNLLNLYIHFPYCQSNCDYCVYPSTQLRNKQQLNDYLSYLIDEMKLFSPIFKGLKFKTLSIGGGTPSLLSESQLSELIRGIYTYFEFEEQGEKSIEFNPNTTTYEKLNVLDNYCFNKLSIGVQSLSQRVLNLIKRNYQNIEKIKETISNFKKTNIGFINVDMLLGLYDDSSEEFLYSIETIFAMQPNLICVYPLKVNDNYLKKRYRSNEDFFRFYYPLFNEVTKNLPSIAKKYGFVSSYEDPKNLSYVHPFSFRLKNDDRKDVNYHYSNFKSEPYSTLGLGFYAESCINNSMRYILVDKKHTNTMFLKNFSTNPEDFLYNMNNFMPRYQEVKFITHSVCKHFTVSRMEYKKMFQTDILDDFPYAIKSLEFLNKVKIDNNSILFSVNEEKELYALLLFFVGRKMVLNKIMGEND